MAEPEIVIAMDKVCTRFGSHAVHTDLVLQVRRGEILAIAGGSGSGKSVLMREMILLQRPSSGSIRLFGHDTVWSYFGDGYGFIPVVLPMFGLGWLWRHRHDRATTT